MARIYVVVFAIMLCGGAQAASPQFDMDHFCTNFAGNHGGAGMGDLAKAVCLMSEQSTKTVVDKAWDRVPAASKESCLKAAGESYMYLAKCLGSVGVAGVP
jgi:hypothetical protein